MAPTSTAFALSLALLVLAAPACERPPDTNDDPTAETSKAKAKTEPGEAEPLPDVQSLLEPGIAPADDAPTDACLSACVDARRMEAMDADAISLLCAEDCAECESECAAEETDLDRSACGQRCADAMTPAPPEHLP